MAESPGSSNVPSLAVACAQIDGGDRTRPERRAHAVAAVERAASAVNDKGADNVLVLLPELWPVGFFHSDEYAQSSEGADGETVRALAQAARDNGCWVLGGSYIERSSRGLHNTAVLLDPQGQVRLRYRKMHLFGLQSAEAELLTAGEDVGSAAAPWGRVGAFTCYDLRFPELARDLVAQGAHMLLVVAAWPAARIAHWQTLLRARAIESQAWVVACNTAGNDAGVTLGGHSAIIAPDGRVVAEAGADEEILTATVDVSEADRVRAAMPFLRDARYTVQLHATPSGHLTPAAQATVS